MYETYDPKLTPRSNTLDADRRAMCQERTPAYGDALALCKELEREANYWRIKYEEVCVRS